MAMNATTGAILWGGPGKRCLGDTFALLVLYGVVWNGTHGHDSNGHVPEEELSAAELARLHGFEDLSNHFVGVQRRYKPRRYEGAVTLLRAQTFAFPPTLGWKPSELPALQVTEIRGDHLGMMRQPFVSGLARALRDALEAADPAVARERVAV